MFKCERCKRITGPREKRTLVTVETREKTYYEKRGYRTKEYHGHEIVRQVAVCLKCLKEGEA